MYMKFSPTDKVFTHSIELPLCLLSGLLDLMPEKHKKTAGLNRLLKRAKFIHLIRLKFEFFRNLKFSNSFLHQ